MNAVSSSTRNSEPNGTPRIPALALKVNPGNERDVQEGQGMRVLAVWTMGRGWNDALPQGHPVNAHIEKAAHHGTKDKKHDRPEFKGDGSPAFRIEDGVDHRFVKP